MKRRNIYDPKRQGWRPYFIMAGYDCLAIAAVCVICAIALWVFYVKTL